MVTTTFAAVVLSAALANEATVAPAWESNYTRATETAVAQRKPLAVFIGRGEAGYAKVVGGDMPTEANRLLATNYVAVYLNTETAEGKRLATAFGVSEGLVLSCRGCQVQALKYGGPVPAVELAGFLTKYGSPTAAVTTTEHAGTAVAPAPAVGCATGRCGTAPVVVSGCANGRCGTVVPAGYTYAPRTYAPAYTGGSYCPTGRCPNAR